MAAASPTPLSSYHGSSRMSRQATTRPVLRRNSPVSLLGQSHGFAADAPPVQSMGYDGDSSDDEAPKLSALAMGLLQQSGPNSPDMNIKQTKIRITRSPSQAGTPEHNTITPAPSLRIKRVPLRGAPMRKGRRTPQGEDDHPSSQDQENVPSSVTKLNSSANHDLLIKSEDPIKLVAHEEERPIPLAPRNINTPLRPAPPPPPKMSVLETATAAAGASTTKSRRKRNHIMINGKVYSQMGKIGKGGSSDVYRVMAENCKMFALKRVKLEDADEAAIRGYKGEIDLLRKLDGVERVVRLFDWEIDEQKQLLSVLMDIGESDMSRILRLKLDAENAQLDLSFTRYYWKEMLECVAAVHDYDIVHSDLKPANFLLVQGRLKLIDFGIANAIDIENTVNIHRDSHIGTPNYMSPESLEDTNASMRGPPGGPVMGKMMKLGKPSDVWSLGCILYQMVYGRPPFAHIPNQIHRVMAIINPSIIIDFPSHGVGGVKIPPGLRSTLRNCLQRDPSRRPTISDLLDEHDAFLYPDNSEDLRIPQEVLGQIIQRLADRFRDTTKEPPTDEEIKGYAGSFYSKIRQLLEER